MLVQCNYKHMISHNKIFHKNLEAMISRVIKVETFGSRRCTCAVSEVVMWTVLHWWLLRGTTTTTLHKHLSILCYHKREKMAEHFVTFQLYTATVSPLHSCTVCVLISEIWLLWVSTYMYKYLNSKTKYAPWYPSSTSPRIGSLTLCCVIIHTYGIIWWLMFNRCKHYFLLDKSGFNTYTHQIIRYLSYIIVMSNIYSCFG